jgi:small subunit ribosomal protein S15
MANATINAIKKELFKTYGGSEKNTGSVEAQVALLTERINHISKHLKGGNAKDFSSNRSLVNMVGRRKRLLAYMQRTNLNGYRELIAKLGLRK